MGAETAVQADDIAAPESSQPDTKKCSPAGPGASVLAGLAWWALAAGHPAAAAVFVALAQQRAQGRAYRSLTDEPDVAALAARLALSAH